MHGNSRAIVLLCNPYIEHFFIDRPGLDQRRPAHPLTVPGMISVPYSVELNDLMLFSKGTGPEFVQTVKDQYEQLRADSADSGRVLAPVRDWSAVPPRVS